MKSIISLMSVMALMVGCAHGVDDPQTNDPVPTTDVDASVPSFGVPDESCDNPEINGALCRDYQSRDPGDFHTGKQIYQYSILCKEAAKTCLPWSVDPNKYSDTSWVYCCEGPLYQPVH